MASQKSRLKKIQEQAEKIESSFSNSDRTSLTDQLDDRLVGIASAALVLFALYLALTWFPGRSVADIVTQHPEMAILAAVLTLSMIFISDNFSITFSFPFALITVAAFAVVWGLLPDTIQSVIALESWLGVELPALSGIQFFALSLIAAGAFWAIEARVTGKAKGPATVTDYVTRKYGKLVDVYSRMGVLVGLLGLFMVYIVLSNGAELVGQVGAVLGMEPFLSSNLFATAAGFAALGGELPILGSLPILRDLTPSGWLFLTVGAIILAAGVAYEATGRTSRLFG